MSGFFAIITTACVLLSANPIHALLYLITSLLFISCNLFVMRAPFAGAIEVIIYAGAIMVLFVFTIMMLNVENIHSILSKKKSLLSSIKTNLGVLLLMSNLLIIFLCVIFKKNDCFINVFASTISLKKIGMTLFSSYMLAVEIASFLLLSALISVLHIAQKNNIHANFDSIQLSEYKSKK